jgi:hypothetical protein
MSLNFVFVSLKFVFVTHELVKREVGFGVQDPISYHSHFTILILICNSNHY